MNDDLEAELWVIALLDPYENGPAVYAAQSMLRIILDPDDGTEEKFDAVEKLTDFIIYPNPAKDQILFKGLFDIERSAFISISDINGKEIIKSSGIDLSLPFSLSSLSAGIYFIKIEQQNNLLYQGKLFIINSGK